MYEKSGGTFFVCLFVFLFFVFFFALPQRKLDTKRNTGLTVTHGGNSLNMANSDMFPGNMAT